MMSLIETLIWAGLIIWLVLRFENPLSKLLTSLQSRIDSGSSVKAGPFELSEATPQEPMKQAARAASEINEIFESEGGVEPHPSESRFIRSNYLLAEELAIRAIESEFNKSIQRQVTFGSDLGFDGVFTLGGQLQVIETKYFTKRIDYQRIKISIAKLKSAYEKNMWKNVRIIFVLVAEDDPFSQISQSQLESIAIELQADVIFRSYSLSSLQEKFGA